MDSVDSQRLPLDPDAIQPGSRSSPHVSFLIQLTVFIGGAIGVACRYYIELLLPTDGNEWPVSTFLINMSGAFLLGLLLGVLAHRGEELQGQRLARLGIGTGLIGGFTTYSTFVLEVAHLADEKLISLSITYAAVTVIGGIIFSALGILIGTKFATRQRGSKL